MLRQHGADGNFKYLFAGADLMDKNIQMGLSPALFKMISNQLLNVALRVKQESELIFESRIRRYFDDCSRKTIYTLLNFINLKSLEELNELAKTFMLKYKASFIAIREGNYTLEYFLKTIFMTIYNLQPKSDINSYISYVSGDEFENFANKIVSDFISTDIDLCEEFDNQFKKTELDTASKIYLVIRERAEMIYNDLKQFRPNDVKDYLLDKIQYILERLACDAAKLFFSLLKSILDECHSAIPMPTAIEKLFKELVKKFKGDLIAIERELLLSMRRERNNFINRYKFCLLDKNISGGALTLKTCFVCGGQGFV